jgi:hypothetical protein
MFFESQEAKEARAKEAAEMAAFMGELEAMPQFISTLKGLLHGLSGCLVHNASTHIVLCWVETYAGLDGRKALLATSEQRSKYMVLVKAEAALLGLESNGAADASASNRLVGA